MAQAQLKKMPRKSPAASGSKKGAAKKPVLKEAAPPPSVAAAAAKKIVRLTADDLATKQREISVSEFFTKNRHLLGFDSPAKALLTTVKEAVDNALDACEEASILPDLSDRDSGNLRDAVPRGGAGQRARNREGADPQDLRPASLRLQVPPAPPVARPAGNRNLGGGHVRPAHHREADHGRLPHRREEAGPQVRNPDRHAAKRPGRGFRQRGLLDTRPRDPGRDRDRGDVQEGAALGGRIRRADRDGQSARADHLRLAVRRARGAGSRGAGASQAPA